MFAAKENGVAKMLQSLLPPEILAAIMQVSTQLPLVLDQVKATADGILAAQQRIEAQQAELLALMKQAANQQYGPFAQAQDGAQDRPALTDGSHHA